MKSFTPEEVVRLYRTANDPDRHCSTIAQKLLSGTELTNVESEFEQQLNELILSSDPLAQNLVVYSGRTEAEITAMMEGSYPSFMSITTSLGEAIRFANQKGALVKFIIPAGASAINISGYAGDAATLESNEWLLPKNVTFEVSVWTSALTDEESLLFGFGTTFERYEASIINLNH